MVKRLLIDVNPLLQGGTATVVVAFGPPAEVLIFSSSSSLSTNKSCSLVGEVDSGCSVAVVGTGGVLRRARLPRQEASGMQLKMGDNHDPGLSVWLSGYVMLHLACTARVVGFIPLSSVGMRLNLSCLKTVCVHGV